MQNLLINLVEKISKMEELGIYVENIDISDRYKLMDDNPMTLTGKPMPAGEYYQAQLLVLVAVDKPSDEIEILKTQLKNYPEMQETFTVCKKKNNNETPSNIGTIIRRDTAIKGAKKATKSEYLEDYIPKKTVKKAKP